MALQGLMTIQELRQEGQDLAPSATRMAEMRSVVHAIVQTIHGAQSTDGTKFSSEFLGGSLGKGTSLRESDADLVVYCTNQSNTAALPPQGLVALLNHILAALEDSPNIDGLQLVGRTPQALLLRVDNTYVDLLVARDFCTGNKKAGNPDQACAALEHIKHLPTEIQRQYSVCFAELTVEWFKQQTGTTNAFVRLVKHRLLLSDEHLMKDKNGNPITMRTHAERYGITGYFIEIVAVYVAQRVAKRLKKLQVMSNAQGAERLKPDQLHLLHFEELRHILNSPETLKVVIKPDSWPQPVSEMLGESSPYYEYNKNATIKKRPCPAVMDPVNPINNLAALIKKDGWKLLRKGTKAKHMLRRMGPDALNAERLSLASYEEHHPDRVSY